MSEKRELWELQSMQAAPLSVKISLTKTRIREWVNKWGEDGVYVSFSGGKDSTVLLHLVREKYPNIPVVFVDTGLEFPEIRQFVKTFDNVIWLKPKLTFRQVIEKYGYPFISKEVAECVYGARKYLKSIIGNTPPQYEYYFKKLCGSDQYQKLDRGGTTTNIENSEASVLIRNGEASWSQQIWQAIQYNHGHKCGGGYAPWRFGAVTGILTSKNTFDARLRKDYRQLSNSTPDGNPSEEGQGDDGEYP